MHGTPDQQLAMNTHPAGLQPFIFNIASTAINISSKSKKEDKVVPVFAN